MLVILLLLRDHIFEYEQNNSKFRLWIHTYTPIQYYIFKIWDYAGDGDALHRLIHNKSDGKLVEFPDPINLDSNNRTRTVMYNDEADEISKGKISSVALEYEYLLTSQLESRQRDYFLNKIS